MPAKASELAKVAQKLGFEKVRQKGSHARWKHPDGRSTTIPVHGNGMLRLVAGYFMPNARALPSAAHHSLILQPFEPRTDDFMTFKVLGCLFQ